MRKEEKENFLKMIEIGGYLDYGSIIPREIFEKLFGIEYQENMTFLGPFLEMKMFIEEEGYLCTTSNMEDGCLRILDVEEMGMRSNRIQSNLIKRMSRLQNSMTKAKISEFGSKEYREHMHETNKVICALNALTSALSRF